MIETLSIVGTQTLATGSLDDRLLKRLYNRRQIRRSRRSRSSRGSRS